MTRRVVPWWASSSLRFIAAMSLFSSGCLVPEPEPFREPERTPPFLEHAEAVPPVEVFVELKTDDPVTQFTIPVRSEDLGEELTALVYLDFGLASERFVYNLSEAPSTFDDPGRSIDFPYSPRAGDCLKPSGEEAGCCRQLTLLVMHDASVDPTAVPQRPDQTKSIGDLAIAVWWLAIDAPEGDPTSIGACPQ
jgi:hypothetical protein